MPDLAVSHSCARSASFVVTPDAQLSSSRTQSTDREINDGLQLLSNQVGSDPPNANLPSKQSQTEEEMEAAAREEAKALQLHENGRQR